MLWVLTTHGCMGSPPVAGPKPPSEMERVDILDPWFVKHEGIRIPLEELLFRMRMRGLEWERKQIPSEDRVGLELIGVGKLSGRELNRALTDLRLSGVPHIDMR